MEWNKDTNNYVYVWFAFLPTLMEDRKTYIWFQKYYRIRLMEIWLNFKTLNEALSYNQHKQGDT